MALGPAHVSGLAVPEVWSLPGLEKAEITCIRADVVQAFTALADPTTELEGLGDAEWLLCASQMQEQRKAFLQQELQKDLIFVPIYAGRHWTLLQICRFGALQVRYYDSLQQEAAGKTCCRVLSGPFSADATSRKMQCSKTACRDRAVWLVLLAVDGDGVQAGPWGL